MDGRAAILQQRYLLAELLVEQLLQKYQIAQQLELLIQRLQRLLPAELLGRDIEMPDQYGLNRTGDFYLRHGLWLLG